jgi:DNA repair photolyase
MVDHPPAALVVQTRSPLVLRDADLLACIPRCGVSVTVTTEDESVRRSFEPNSPSVALRVDALRRLRAAGVRTQAAVSPLLPCDATRLAATLEPVCDRVVVDDFFEGDGDGGRRSRAALERLRELGYGDWARPGYARETLAELRRVLGAERVQFSRAGFNALDWIAAAPNQVQSG